VKRIVLAIALVAGIAMPAVAEEVERSTEKPVPITERRHEILSERTSGFWTSNRPAKHGAYRWRLLYVGIGLAAVTGFVLYRVLRRATVQRFAGAGAPAVPRAEKPKSDHDDPPDVPSALP
jgi:hypothetical protein